MKNTIFSALFVGLLSIAFAQAQPPKPPKPPMPPNPEKVEALKVAFITKRLALTPEEAQKFWPVYNQYEAEKEAITEATIGSYKEEKKPLDQMTEAEVNKVMENYILFKQKDLELTKKYLVEFKKILPPVKVAKLLTADDQFKRMLLKKAQSAPDAPKGPKGPHHGGFEREEY